MAPWGLLGVQLIFLQNFSNYQYEIFFGIKVFFSKINFKENFEAFSTVQTLEQRNKSGVKPYTRSAVNLD